jgi:hypothetical protein
MLALKKAFKDLRGHAVCKFHARGISTATRQRPDEILFDYGEEIGLRLALLTSCPRSPTTGACYRFMQEKKKAGKLTIGIAVQDGNYLARLGCGAPKTWPDIVPDWPITQKKSRRELSFLEHSGTLLLAERDPFFSKEAEGRNVTERHKFLPGFISSIGRIVIAS